MEKVTIAKVAVERSSITFDRFFSYIVPENISPKLSKGCRVIVPFGKGNIKCQAFVFDVKVLNRSELPDNLKYVCEILDNEPILNSEMFTIIEYLVKNTFCTYFEALKCLIPFAVGVKVLKLYYVENVLDLDLSILTENERLIVEILRKKKDVKLLEKEFYKFTGSNKSFNKHLSNLIEKGIVKSRETIKKNFSDNRSKYISVKDTLNINNVKLSEKQLKVVNYIRLNNNVTIKDITYNCGVTESVVRTLLKKGTISFNFNDVNIPSVSHSHSNYIKKEITLTKEQNKIFEELLEKCDKNEYSIAYLKGVTGSGKTYVFIKLIQEVISKGKKVIFLVPEIGLTPQVIVKFRSIFGDNLSIIHSNLAVGERFHEWNRIKNGHSNIVVGTRSAVFAPLDNIGLIVMDEENELAYKSENSPRYHARDIAKLRCHYNNALLLLSSATPSLESHYNSQIGKYSLHVLNNRYSGGKLPEVNIIDLKNTINTEKFSCISDTLYKEILRNFKLGNQSILFINRRGHSAYARCFSCNKTIECKNCSICMTYHKYNNMLVCHYCFYMQSLPKSCSECNSDIIKLNGIGTQKVEEELNLLIPDLKILRMDSDTVNSKHAYEEKFSLFLDQKYDIMVGTQMIAKGLNFPNVTLVGIISIDTLLNSNDFRGNERAFSLITQVIGRSGRGNKEGKAYIQTYMPENDIIQHAAFQDYDNFYNQEIKFRKLMLYPPYCDICVIGVSGKSEKRVEDFSEHILNMLIYFVKTKMNSIPIKILGISTPVVYKVNNKYRKRIIIKCKFNNLFKKLIKLVLDNLKSENKFRNISIFVDINGDINI